MYVIINLKPQSTSLCGTRKIYVVWGIGGIHLDKGEYLPFHASIGDQRTIITDIYNYPIYGEGCSKLSLQNNLWLIGERPEGVD